MRIASFNVENLFARPAAMDRHVTDSDTRRKVLADQARVSQLLELDDYSPVAAEILEILDRLGIRDDDAGQFVILRQLRGHLLQRHRNAATELLAHGRSDWVGWIELKVTAVNERATENTARVIHDLAADVLTVVEAEARPVLQKFSQMMLPAVGGTPYEQVMLVDGNDDRGIDVGVLARPAYQLVGMRTHVFDADVSGVVFSRDCCEYHFKTPMGSRLVVLANHFKSKGYASPGDPVGAQRRFRQAVRVARIYQDLVAAGQQYVAICGDLNDDPSSEALDPLLGVAGLSDVSGYPGFEWNHRHGTYGSGNEQEKIDYILLSTALSQRLVGGGVFRKGVWHGNRTTDPWDIYPTLTSPVEAASDHAAIWADITDF